jgi:hypothetical protein
MRKKLAEVGAGGNIGATDALAANTPDSLPGKRSAREHAARVAPRWPQRASEKLSWVFTRRETVGHSAVAPKGKSPLKPGTKELSCAARSTVWPSSISLAIFHTSRRRRQPRTDAAGI